MNAQKPELSKSLFSEEGKKLLDLLLEKEGFTNLPQVNTIPLRKPKAELAPSFAQERLWFLDQLVPGNSAYNMFQAFQLTGPLEVHSLVESLNALLARQEGLRMSFAAREGQPVPVIAPRLTLALPVVDLQHLTPTEQAAQLQTGVQAEAQRPFDLAHGPLLRVQLWQLAATEHVLLLTLHHIISDGWSHGVLLRELSQLYAGYCRGEPVSLPPLPIQYADYTAWQRTLLVGDELAEHLAYWRTQLAGAPAALDLPTDHPRPAVQTFRGARHRFKFSQPLSDAVREFSQREGVTLFMTLLAAFQVLLAHYSGQDDIVVGTPVAGRTYTELEGLIGFFVNTLVLRTRLGGNLSFRELLRQVREMALGAYAHQDLPFERLVDELNPERDLSRQALFQVMFVLQNIPTSPLDLLGLTTTSLSIESGVSRFDLYLSLEETAEGLIGALEYNTDLFEARTVERMSTHFERLLQGLVVDPTQRWKQWSLLTEAEQREMLGDWNATAADYPRDWCVHQLVEAQVERTPEAIAVVYGEACLTYGELNARANQLAHALRKRGVGPEERVGICLERSLDMVIGVLAVLKAGGAYVALAPDYPRARLLYLLEDTQPRLLLTQAPLTEKFLEYVGEVLCLDRDEGLFIGEASDNLEAIATMENLAYVVYTSGSTGYPKGVMTTHGSVVNYLTFIAQAYGLNAADFVLQIASLGFDASVRDLVGPLTVGASVVILESMEAKDPLVIKDKLKEHEITCMLSVVPSLLNRLFEFEGDILQSCDALRLILVSGENLSARDVQQAYTYLNDRVQIVNQYGPTECTLTSTYYPVVRLLTERSSVSVGRPIPNAQVYILNEYLQPVPVGVSGAVYIGGVGLARGYYQRPDLTAEKFIPNPFSSEPGACLYRTGDWARYLPEGHIEFLGRVDHQVKLRGYRVELEEIVAVLKQHPAVNAAVVVTQEDAWGDKSLTAYVAPRRESAASLQGHPRYLLPNNMGIVHLNKHETDFFYEQIFVKQTDLRHGISVREGDCIFDVGANIGLFTLFVQQIAQNLSVYTFEPLPPIFEKLQLNTQLYAAGTKLFPCGLSSVTKTADFTYYPYSSCQSGFYADLNSDMGVLKTIILNQQHSPQPGFEFPVGSLDNLLEIRSQSEVYTCQLKTISDIIQEHQIDQIDLLKLDVEKSEYDVLLGIRPEDWKKIKQIVIEVHDVGGRVNLITELLKKRGYGVSVEQDELLKDSELYAIYAIRDRQALEASTREALYPVPCLKGTILSSENLHQFLDEKLPDYMIPAKFVLLEQLPLTPNGKIDRQALPAPGSLRPLLDVPLVPPSTLVEVSLADIWCDMLGIEQLGVHDNFFALGGHSLLALRVLSRIRSVFQIELPLRLFFENPTIAGLAGHLGASASIQSTPATIPARRLDSHNPASFAQQRLWLLNQLLPNTSVYHLPLVCRLRGPLSIPALWQSLNALVARHEALRTSFAVVEGQPMQVIAPRLKLELPVIDWRNVPPAVQAMQIQACIQEEVQWPFDLAHGPLLRAQLLRLTEQEHVLILTMHHIISDGWSQGVLSRELSHLYAESLRGSPVVLPPLPIQYADYASWQREVLAGEELAEHLAYWRAHLAGMPAALDLPTDHPRPAVQTFRGARHFLKFSKPLTAALKEFSQREGVTLFMTLLAALQLLLAYYSGQDDIVVGTPVAGRTRSELEGLIGFFVNTLVLRTRLSGNQSFRHVLAQVRDVALGAYAHQDLPFEKLVDELNPERDLSRQALFQVMFVLQNAPTATLELTNLQATSLRVESGTAKFDLTLGLSETDSGLQGAWEYNTDLFEARTIERVSTHFERLLHGLVVDPTQRWRDWSLLTEAEKQKMLRDWNATAAAYPRDKCIHQLVEAQVERTPEAVAVVCGEVYLTYQELNARANQLAHALRKLGVGPEVVVGVYLDRSVEMVIGLLGILKAGGAYVPIDATYPRERVKFILENSRASVLLSEQNLARMLPELSLPILCLDPNGQSLASEIQTNLISGVTPENLAYVIYTSGSTGQPKGVLIQHGSVVNFITAFTQVCLEFSVHKILQYSSISFDVSVSEIFPVLTLGGCLVVLGPGEQLDIERTVCVLAEHEIPVVGATPTMLAQLNERKKKLPQLRLVLSGGETLSMKDVSAFLESLVVSNGYGPTETTVCSTAYRLEKTSFSGTSIPIGKPIANCHVYVLDRYLRCVPIGCVGELFISGAGLSRGYLNDPETTAEKFIANPFAAGKRMYRTGDQVRWLPDGNLEFMGRVDQQIKIHGHRIELGEIEATLNQYPAVHEAVVLVREDQPGRKRLVAYVVPDSPQTLSINEVRNFLQANLPSYMVPSVFVFLDSMPLTSSGKLDRRALPPPPLTSIDLEDNFVEPRTPVEAALAQIWARVLELEHIGVHHNFFELGGDSLLALHVLTLANENGFRLTPTQLMQHQTIAELAVAARGGETIKPAQTPPENPTEAMAELGWLPLLPVQKRFFDLKPNAPHYWNVVFYMGVPNKLQVEALRRAIEIVINHHAALRAQFIQTEFGWEQRIVEAGGEIPFQHYDLTQLNEAEVPTHLTSIISALQSSLDITQGPIIRFAYFSLREQLSDRLLMLCNHLVMDAWARQILIEDLLKAYTALADGRLVDLLAKTTSIREWAYLLQRTASSPPIREELDYWINATRPGGSKLVADFPGGRLTDKTETIIKYSLPASLSESLLHSIRNSRHLKITEVLLAAFARALSELTQGTSWLIDIVNLGRSVDLPGVDLSRTVGWLVYHFPLRLEVPPTTSALELLESVSEAQRQAPSAGRNYGLLRYMCSEDSVRMTLASQAQPEVLFNYLGRWSGAEQFPGLVPAKESVGVLEAVKNTPDFHILYNAAVVDDRIVTWLRYSNDSFKETTIKCLSEAIASYLQSVEENFAKLSRV